MTIVYSATASRTTYILGEDIRLDLSIENHGTAPVTVPDPEANINWQPAHTLLGPGGHAASFDLHRVVRGEPQVLLTLADAALITIAPGAAWTGSLALSDLVPVAQPGAYSFCSRLTWGQIDVQAPAAAFVVEPLRVVSANVGLALPPTSAPEIFATWLHEHDGKAAIFQAQFFEKRPDLGETVRRGVIRLAEPPIGAADVLSPSAGHSRFDDLFGWIAWREGGDLVVLPSTGVGTGRIALGFEPALVLRPALATGSHQLDIFVIGGGALHFVRFEDQGYGAPPAGSVLWSVPLPSSVVAAAVVAQPGAEDHVRHLVLVSTSSDGAVLLHAAVNGTRAPTGFSEAVIGDYVPTSDAPPGLLAQAKGGVRASVLMASSDDPRRYRLLEVLLGRQAESEASAHNVSITLPTEPVAARVGYFRHQDGGFRRSWVIRGKDGIDYGRGPSGGTMVLRSARTEVVPLELLVLSQAAYLLGPSPVGGLALEHLEP
jgi:hypothetical protein